MCFSNCPLYLILSLYLSLITGMVRPNRDDGKTNYPPLLHRDVMHDHDGNDTGSVHPLLVNITQDTAGCVHHVSDGDFREHPVRWHGRIQLIQTSQDEFLNLKWKVLTLRKGGPPLGYWLYVSKLCRACTEPPKKLLALSGLRCCQGPAWLGKRTRRRGQRIRSILLPFASTRRGQGHE
jgi:hypothetical protein